MTLPAGASARKAAQTADSLAVLAIVLITVSVVWSYLLAPAVNALSGPDIPWRDALISILQLVVLAAPSILFLCALEYLRRALKHYVNSSFLSAQTGAFVRRAGECAVFALIAKIIISPSLHRWIGDGRFNGFDIDFETADLAMLAFAAFIIGIGHVLDIAARVKAEHDEII